jgi:hypothetical protein
MLSCLLVLAGKKTNIYLSSQTKDYATGIFCFSAKHAALRRKSKDWLVGIRMMCPSGATLYAKRIGGEMVCKLVPSAVDCGYKPLSSQTKDYVTGIFCFSAKHAALRRKSKDWLVGIRMMCPRLYNGHTQVSDCCCIMDILK